MVANLNTARSAIWANSGNSSCLHFLSSQNLEELCDIQKEKLLVRSVKDQYYCYTIIQCKIELCIYVTDGMFIMNRTTSVPKSVLCYSVDKVELYLRLTIECYTTHLGLWGESLAS